MLAGQLGKEWRELAAALNLRPMRIQAILRQHVNKETNDTRFDMLLTWAKRVPKAVDKVKKSCNERWIPTVNFIGSFMPVTQTWNTGDAPWLLHQLTYKC